MTDLDRRGPRKSHETDPLTPKQENDLRRRADGMSPFAGVIGVVEVRALFATLDAARDRRSLVAENKALLDLIDSIEWVQTISNSSPRCPSCDEMRPTTYYDGPDDPFTEGGHAPGCRLDAALHHEDGATS